jgi:hypothetical protein
MNLCSKVHIQSRNNLQSLLPVMNFILQHMEKPVPFFFTNRADQAGFTHDILQRFFCVITESVIARDHIV